MVRPAIDERAILDLHAPGLQTLADRLQHLAEKHRDPADLAVRQGDDDLPGIRRRELLGDRLPGDSLFAANLCQAFPFQNTGRDLQPAAFIAVGSLTVRIHA